MTRKLKIMENEKHPLDDLKNNEITKNQLSTVCIFLIILPPKSLQQGLLGPAPFRKLNYAVAGFIPHVTPKMDWRARA